MQPDNKHKPFSKEELFRLIDEKRSLPPEADDFDKEAMEGLSMLTDRERVEGLNNSIDEILRSETKKAKRKKNIYIFSAAASVILIIGLFFLLKDISFDKKENAIAENNTPANETAKQEDLKTSDEKIPLEKKLEEENNKTSVTVADAEGKEEKKDESTGAFKSKENATRGDLGAAPPAEVTVATQEKSESRKTANEELEKEADDRSQGGKDYKSVLAKREEDAKRSEPKLADKEKDKTRYLTNTVWTTTPAAAGGAGVAVDESKKRTDDYRSKNQTDADISGVAGNDNVAAPQKSAELAQYEKQKSNGPDKKTKNKKEQTAKPDSAVVNMLDGYAYYDKVDKGLAQGGEPPKTPQSSAAPVQTQTESGSFAKAADIPAEQKADQNFAGKKSGKHEGQPDNANADLQQTQTKSAIRANSNGEEFVGGTETMQQYVKKNLKISSPQKSGTIEAEFVVNKDGKVDTGSVKITKKIKNCNPCSEDVKELVKAMPPLKPAMEKGKATSRKQKISIDYNVK
jgi:hypothetical protein